MPRKIEISHKTVIFTTLFLILLWFLYHIRDLIMELFIALLIMAILNHLANRLSKYKIPRGISVLIVYILALSFVVTAIVSVIPPLVEQTANFVSILPSYMENIGLSSSLGEQVFEQTISQLGSVPVQLAKFTASLFSNVLGVITVLIFAFYLLLARNKLDDQLVFLFGEEKKKKVGKTIDILEKRLGGWARGQLILMVSVGVLTYLGLILLGIPHALPLAILAGLLEIVPMIGPILAAIPTIIIGIGISPWMGMAAAALAFLVQRLENYLLVPKIMEKSIGVNPIITLVALSIGFRVAGVAGVIISVPLLITIQVLTKQYFSSK